MTLHIYLRPYDPWTKLVVKATECRWIKDDQPFKECRSWGFVSKQSVIRVGAGVPKWGKILKMVNMLHVLVKSKLQCAKGPFFLQSRIIVINLLRKWSVLCLRFMSYFYGSFLLFPCGLTIIYGIKSFVNYLLSLCAY